MAAVVELTVRIMTAVVLLGAVWGKARAPASTVVALASLDPRLRGRPAWAAWGGALVADAACLVTVVLAPAPWLAGPAVVFAAYAALLGRAVRRGAAGRSCGCFGSRGTVSWRAAGRALSLALLLGGVAVWPQGFSGDGVDVERAALALMAVALTALTVAVLALAREIGILRLAVGSAGVPLELPGEGPPVGNRLDISGWCPARHDGLAVAVFTSAGCAMCQGLGPTLAYLAQDPWLAVARFDEEVDHAQWTAFAVPGSPFAVVLTPDGTVRAKGTFNGLAQLEGLVASGARRHAPEGRAVA